MKSGEATANVLKVNDFVTIEKAEVDKENKDMKKAIFSEYALMMWDGLGFFGFSDTKLARLKGKKVTWLTPFLSWFNTPMLIIGLVVMGAIIVSEVGNLGN